MINIVNNSRDETNSLVNSIAHVFELVLKTKNDEVISVLELIIRICFNLCNILQRKVQAKLKINLIFAIHYKAYAVILAGQDLS